MKNVVDLLSEKDRQSLAAFYEKPEFKALTRLVEIERLELAKDSLASWQQGTPQQAYLAGGADKLKYLLKLVRQINQMANKKD